MGPVSVRPFRRIQTTDRDLNLLQSHIADAVRSIGDTPRWLQAVSLLAGPTIISHGLGRNWVSYWLGNYDTSVTVKPLVGIAVSGSIPDRSKYLVLQASAPVVADIFVF